MWTAAGALAAVEGFWRAASSRYAWAAGLAAVSSEDEGPQKRERAAAGAADAVGALLASSLD
jgi:hypothetical protein